MTASLRPRWEALLRTVYSSRPAHDLTTVFVAAHPDDEVIGAGATLLRDAPRCLVVHVTDGAPRDLVDARAAGFATRDAYAVARRNEARNAISLARELPVDIVSLDVEDQRASESMDAIVSRLASVLREIGPALVVTHPYEGGHPDHDATCFAAHAACAAAGKVPVVEFTSYHDRQGETRYGEFLDHPGAGAPLAFELSPPEQSHKRQLFQCYATQGEVLRHIPVEVERFRLARAYDFSRPPHEGPLHYERFPWGMTGERWRTLAAATMVRLRRAGPA